MSFKAIFKISGGKEYPIVKVSYTLNQATDEKSGRPTSSIIGGFIECWVKSTDDTALLAWMCDPAMKKSGSVIFNKREEDAKLKELMFEDAYCIFYEESFDYTGEGGPFLEHFKITAKKLKMGNDVEHTNEWTSL